jgi:aspartate/glutamate racemase
LLDYEVSCIRDQFKREDIQRTIAQFESGKIKRISKDLRKEIIDRFQADGSFASGSGY